MTKEQRLIRRALELVRDGLRSGGIPAHNFDMDTWQDGDTYHKGHHCGTVHCIGGWAEAALRLAGHKESANTVGDSNSGSPLGRLFWTVFHASPERSALAIDRYLAGQDPWPAR